jgi:aminomethyltransferase
VPNAANTAEVVSVLAAGAPEGVDVVDRHRDLAVLAVQGPRSAELVSALGLPAELDYMAFARASHGSVEVVVCRTGYTGEHGYELLVPWGAAGEVWDGLLAEGAAYGVLPCGLGARDTLRTEMGYPLHGQDLSREISPVEAGAGWAVGWAKPAFRGRAALVAQREAGPARRSVGLLALDRGIPRPHMGVLAVDGTHDRRGDERDVLAHAQAGHRLGPRGRGRRARTGRRGAGRRTRSSAALRGHQAALRRSLDPLSLSPATRPAP